MLVGEPMYPKKGQNSNELTAELHARLSALLEEAQSTYPDKPSGPADSWWLPAHLGGTAPTLEEAAEMDARDRDARDGGQNSGENSGENGDEARGAGCGDGARRGQHSHSRGRRHGHCQRRRHWHRCQHRQAGAEEPAKETVAAKDTADDA